MLDVTDPGHYCVFWYRSVPLGESYLLLSDAIAPEAFWKKCLQAIASSLEMYAAKENRPLSLSSLSPDPVSIRTACARILEDFHPQILPQRCDVSVVICTRNRAGYLKNCLESLRDQVCQPAEVIVVDNGSDTDETAKVASGFNVRYIREDTRGLDVARNTGARAATGAIVAFTDDDTLPDKLWVYRIYETFRDPKIAAMTGLVIAASLDTEAEVIFEKFWPFNRGYRDKIFDSQFFRARLDDGPPVWEIGAGANMAFRKEIFDEVGYFDERLDVGAAGCSGDSEL
ncbi:MAG TPA: glycosyltransferase family 2 protein, partial [Chryseosolibacter sp.]